MKTDKEIVKETSIVEAKSTPKKAAAVKEAAVKEIPAKKPAVKKAPAKKAVVKETVYLQYMGQEIDKDEVVKKVKDHWTKVLKNKVVDIKSLTLYLKPEENAAYYVINSEVTGSIEL